MSETTTMPAVPLVDFLTVPQPVQAICWTGENREAVRAFVADRGGRLLDDLIAARLVFDDEHGERRRVPAAGWIVWGVTGHLAAVTRDQFHKSYRTTAGEFCEFCGQAFDYPDVVMCGDEDDYVWGCKPCVAQAEAEEAATS